MIEVNYLAILVSAIVTMVVGFAWYSPVLFGNAWIKLMGWTKTDLQNEKKKSDMGKIYMVSFVLALITAYVLSHSITFSNSYLGYSRLASGLTTGFFMWLGFVAPVQLTEVLFGGKPVNLFLINTGYQLASLLAMGSVLAIWS